MELIEGSETAIRTKTPGNYPKENMLHIEHGESLKSRKLSVYLSFQNNKIKLMASNKCYDNFLIYCHNESSVNSINKMTVIVNRYVW